MPQKAARWWSLTRCPSHTRSFLPVVESAGRRVAGFTKISNQSTSSHRPSVGSRRREFRQITNKKRQEGFKSSGLLVVSRGMCGHVAGGLVGRRRAPMAALFYLFQTRFIPDQLSRRYSAGSESTVARIEPRLRHICFRRTPRSSEMPSFPFPSHSVRFPCSQSRLRPSSSAAKSDFQLHPPILTKSAPQGTFDTKKSKNY